MTGGDILCETFIVPSGILMFPILIISNPSPHPSTKWRIRTIVFYSSELPFPVVLWTWSSPRQVFWFWCGCHQYREPDLSSGCCAECSSGWSRACAFHLPWDLVLFLSPEETSQRINLVPWVQKKKKALSIWGSRTKWQEIHATSRQSPYFFGFQQPNISCCW